MFQEIFRLEVLDLCTVELGGRSKHLIHTEMGINVRLQFANCIDEWTPLVQRKGLLKLHL